MNALPDSNSPVLLGLPSTAETLRLRAIGERTLGTLAALQEVAADVGSTSSDQVDVRSQSHLTMLKENIDRYFQLLPTLDGVLPVDELRGSDSRASPMDRCLVREVVKGRSVLEMVRSDLLFVRCGVEFDVVSLSVILR